MSDMVGRGYRGKVVEDAGCEFRSKVSVEVVGVVRVGAGFAEGYRNTTAGIRARNVVGKAQVEKLGGQGACIRRWP